MKDREKARQMTQEREDYMQAQDAHHDMIAMRDPVEELPRTDRAVGQCQKCGAPTKGTLYFNEALIEQQSEIGRLRSENKSLKDMLADAEKIIKENAEKRAPGAW